MRFIPITTNTRPIIIAKANKIAAIDLGAFTRELDQRIGDGFYYGHSYPGENSDPAGKECYVFITRQALMMYYDSKAPDNGRWFSAFLKESV